jgi:lipopolysaccharide export system permease protein
MTLLRRYLMLSIFRGVATVLAVLVGVFAGVEFVAQVGDIGTGDYGFAQALSYVLLRLPRKIFDALPAAALIGSLLSLGNIAVHRELIVMRASGISSAQLLGSVALAGFGLAVVMALLGESLAPSLSAYAAEMRTRAIQDADTDTDTQGQAMWLRDGDRILSLRRHAGDVGYGGGVLLFEVGPDRMLKQIARADAADIDAQNRWVLSNYSETSFLANGVDTSSAREATQTYTLNPNLLVSVVREDMLDTPALQRYIAYLKDNGLDSRRYEIAYWTRLSSVASVVLMTVLALPFVFGGLRSAGTGARLVVGLVIGLSYYVISEVLIRGGDVYDLDPLVVAWAPSAALLVAAVVAFSRAK